MAVDAAGDVYLADSGNARVLRLPAGATVAIPLPFSGLKAPQGVAVDTEGNVYVTDVGSTSVVKLAVDLPSTPVRRSVEVPLRTALESFSRSATPGGFREKELV